MVRALRRLVDEIDIVQLPQGFQIAMPRWMLDPMACGQMPQEAKPRVALSALLRLVELIQSPRLPSRSPAAPLDTSPLTKGYHVSRPEPHVSSSPVAPSQEDALGKVPRIDARALSRGVSSDAGASRAQGLQGKERS